MVEPGGALAVVDSKTHQWVRLADSARQSGLRISRTAPLPLRSSWTTLIGTDRIASSRASPRTCINSSTFPGSIIASQVNGGTIDIHTAPRCIVTTTVATTPSRPLTTTLRGTLILSDVFLLWMSRFRAHQRLTVRPAEPSVDPAMADAAPLRSWVVTLGLRFATQEGCCEKLRVIFQELPPRAVPGGEYGAGALAQFLDGLGDEGSCGASVYGWGFECLEHAGV